MIKKSSVIEILKEEQPFLRKNFRVKRIAVFGSFAQGTPRKNSDVDIFVEFDKPIGLEFIRMVEYLEKKLGRDVDVLTPGGLQGIRLKKVADHIRESLVYV